MACNLDLVFKKTRLWTVYYIDNNKVRTLTEVSDLSQLKVPYIGYFNGEYETLMIIHAKDSNGKMITVESNRKYKKDAWYPGSGLSIGSYGYIHINKRDLECFKRCGMKDVIPLVNEINNPCHEFSVDDEYDLPSRLPVSHLDSDLILNNLYFCDKFVTNKLPKGIKRAKYLAKMRKIMTEIFDAVSRYDPVKLPVSMTTKSARCQAGQHTA